MKIFCADCGWDQDHFFSEIYNPAHKLSELDPFLFGDRSYILNSQCPVAGYEEITIKEFLLLQYEKVLESMRKMKWFTWDEYLYDDEKICPHCESRNLLITTHENGIYFLKSWRTFLEQ